MAHLTLTLPAYFAAAGMLCFLFLAALLFLFILRRVKRRSQVALSAMKEAVQEAFELRKGMARHILSGMPMGLMLSKRETFIYANDYFYSLFAASAGRIEDFSLQSFLSKEDYETVLEEFRRLSPGDAPVCLEFKMRGKEQLWRRFCFVPFQGDLYIWLVEDISNAKTNENALKDYSLFFQVLAYVRGLPRLMPETDFIRSVLSEIVRQYGFAFAFYARKEKDKLIADVKIGAWDEIKDITHIDLKTQKGRTSALAKAFLTGRPFRYDRLDALNYYQQRFRKRKYFSTYGIPVIINGKIEGAVSFFSDKGIGFYKNQEGRMEEFIKEICTHIEQRRLLEKDRLEIQAYEQKLRSKIEALQANEKILETQAREMNIAIQHLTAAKEMAERASKMKTEFLANVSHELRTPLNAILGFSEMMKEETFGKIGNTNYLDYIRYIHSSGEYLLSLINDILDLSRAESGKQRLEETLFPLCPRLRDFAGIVRFYPTAGEKEFRIDCSEDDIFLLADERLFKQIILNLLSNAIKFTNAGGHIWIKGEKRKDGSLQIEIKDDGIGIPADKIKTLFKPFSQVENILTKTHTGSGLGLSLVKRLMELHGGEAWLESEEGQGTRAYVLFPKERVFTKKKAEEKSKKDNINLLKDEKVGLN